MNLSDFKGIWFLLGVAVAYGVLWGFDPHSGLKALEKSGTIVWSLLPIFAFVILITALVNYFLKPARFVKHFGAESGKKGWFLSLASGVLSHGPMYAWYPMLQEMRERGIREGYLVAFLYARSIKIPLLPLMVEYFGWLFTIVLTVYILLGSWIQGVVSNRIGSKRP
ncbi:MAG: permease [Sulfuricurvum sp.]|nr:permease [Sulfuricurvum sp.]